MSPVTTTTFTAERIHDEETLRLLGELSKTEIQIGYAMSTLRHATRPKSVRWESEDRRSNVDVLITVKALIADGDVRILTYGKRPSELLAKYNEQVDAQLAVGRALHAHEAAYTGWQRFWLVVSSAGLVHASMDCHTCNKGRQATQFALLASLSGQTINDLVEALGPTLCSVCFPQAPVEWTDAQRVSPSVAQVLLDSGVEAFEAALAEHNAKAVGRDAKLLAEITAWGAEGVKLDGNAKVAGAERLAKAGLIEILGRSGYSTWKGAWIKTATVKAVAQS